MIRIVIIDISFSSHPISAGVLFAPGGLYLHRLSDDEDILYRQVNKDGICSAILLAVLSEWKEKR